MEILNGPSLRSAIMKELSTAASKTQPLGFDMDKLLSLPLLNSAWKEVLRLRTTAMI